MCLLYILWLKLYLLPPRFIHIFTTNSNIISKNIYNLFFITTTEWVLCEVRSEFLLNLDRPDSEHVTRNLLLFSVISYISVFITKLCRYKQESHKILKMRILFARSGAAKISTENTRGFYMAVEELMTIRVAKLPLERNLNSLGRHLLYSACNELLPSCGF
jgi:hypothetical protein